MGDGKVSQQRWNTSTKYNPTSLQKLAAPAFSLMNARIINTRNNLRSIKSAKEIGVFPDPSNNGFDPKKNKLSSLTAAYRRSAIRTQRVCRAKRVKLKAQPIDTSQKNVKSKDAELPKVYERPRHSPVSVHRQLFRAVSNKRMNSSSSLVKEMVNPLNIQINEGLDPQSDVLHPVVERLRKFLVNQDIQTRKVLVARAQFLSMQKQWDDAELCKTLILGDNNLKSTSLSLDKIEALLSKVDCSGHSIIEIGNLKQLIVIKDQNTSKHDRYCLKPLTLEAGESRVVMDLCNNLRFDDSFKLKADLSVVKQTFSMWLAMKTDPTQTFI